MATISNRLVTTSLCSLVLGNGSAAPPRSPWRLEAGGAFPVAPSAVKDIGALEEAMRNALSEASLGGKGFVIVDWMAIAGEASQQAELLLGDWCGRSTDVCPTTRSLTKTCELSWDLHLPRQG